MGSRRARGKRDGKRERTGKANMTSNRESRTSRRVRVHGPAKEHAKNQKHTENKRRNSNGIHKHNTTKASSKVRKNNGSFHTKQRQTRRKSTNQKKKGGQRKQQKESTKRSTRKGQFYQVHQITYGDWPAIFVAQLNTGVPNEYKGETWSFEFDGNSSYTQLHFHCEERTIEPQARYIHRVPRNQYPNTWGRLLDEMPMPGLDASERIYEHEYKCAHTARAEAWANLKMNGCITSVRRNGGWVRKKGSRPNKRPNKKSGKSHMARGLMMSILFG